MCLVEALEFQNPLGSTVSIFCGFIRANLGLPYVPLERLNEGIRNLYIICRRLTGKQRAFGIKMINKDDVEKF